MIIMSFDPKHGDTNTGYSIRDYTVRLICHALIKLQCMHIGVLHRASYRKNNCGN